MAANDGVVPRDRSNCSPPGMPRIMRLGQYPYEFLITPGRVTINQEAWMQTRTIWTDGRRHLEQPDPTFMGNSIGRWEGDTLVVDTIGISDQLEIDTGMPHSSQFRLTERIHLSPGDPDVLVNEIRMEDPEALEEPFEVTGAIARPPRLADRVPVAENDRNRSTRRGIPVPLTGSGALQATREDRPSSGAGRSPGAAWFRRSALGTATEGPDRLAAIEGRGPTPRIPSENSSS